MFVLSDSECIRAGKAFDRAWEKCLRAGLVTRANLLELRHLMAARILQAMFTANWTIGGSLGMPFLTFANCARMVSRLGHGPRLEGALLEEGKAESV
jgi:hypothetical protein